MNCQAPSLSIGLQMPELSLCSLLCGIYRVFFSLFFFESRERDATGCVLCVAALFGPHRSHHGRLPVCSNEDEEGGSCVAPANVGLVG